MHNCPSCGMRIVSEHPHACTKRVVHPPARSAKKSTESSFLGQLLDALIETIKKLSGRGGPHV